MGLPDLVRVGLDEHAATDGTFPEHADELAKLGAIEDDVDTERPSHLFYSVGHEGHSVGFEGERDPRQLLTRCLYQIELGLDRLPSSVASRSWMCRRSPRR